MTTNPTRNCGEKRPRTSVKAPRHLRSAFTSIEPEKSAGGQQFNFSTGRPAEYYCGLSSRFSSGGKSRMVGWQGLEPWTNALKGHCSTN